MAAIEVWDSLDIRRLEWFCWSCGMVVPERELVDLHCREQPA
jgi:hypothetical protein